MPQHAHFGIKGGFGTFAARANLMGAHSESEPKTAIEITFPLCTAAARSEPKGVLFTDLLCSGQRLLCKVRQKPEKLMEVLPSVYEHSFSSNLKNFDIST